jgi:hypothetical protein
MRSPELAARGDGNAAVPGRHAEMQGLRDEREGELVQARGAVDRETDMSGQNGVDEGGKGLMGWGWVSGGGILREEVVGC